MYYSLSFSSCVYTFYCLILLLLSLVASHFLFFSYPVNVFAYFHLGGVYGFLIRFISAGGSGSQAAGVWTQLFALEGQPLPIPLHVGKV